MSNLVWSSDLMSVLVVARDYLPGAIQLNMIFDRHAEVYTYTNTHACTHMRTHAHVIIIRNCIT